MNYFKRKWLVCRLRSADRFISRELERIRINYPSTPKGLLTQYRYKWLRGFYGELLNPSDWREAWDV